MEPAQQAKSIQKNSSHDSEQRRKRRPSLFPIRNSARRKSSMSESQCIFDPHDTDCNSNRIKHKNSQSAQLDNRESKSETQFEYRTPSGLSDYSSPRTSKSSPKDFIADTPFVPFVHQSLTKTVWQSQQIIPEQKDDLDRKQSQTQIPKNNDLYNQIKQQQQQYRQTNEQDDKSSQLYPSLPDIGININQNQHENIMQNKGNVEVKIEPESEQNSNFHTCIAVSIAIPPQLEEQQSAPEQGQGQGQEQGQGQGQGNEQRHESEQGQGQAQGQEQENNIEAKSKQNAQEQRSAVQQQDGRNANPVLKQQTYSDETSVQYEIINQIQHNQYVSKAHIYQRQEQQRQAQYSDQFQSFNYSKQAPKTKQKKLSFSYLESISVRPTYKPISCHSQQTLPTPLTLTSTTPVHVPRPQKYDNATQIQKIRLQICNPSHSMIKSTKKQNSQMQTSYQQRLAIISKSYNEKIGIPKYYTVSSQQTDTNTKIHEAAQTQKISRDHFSIQEQLNFSIQYNYTENTDDKINRLEKYIKNIYQQKQAQIQQLRNRRSIDTSINTEHTENTSTPTPRGNNQMKQRHLYRSVQDVGSQYDAKDFGNGRPSLKRVSIAAAPIIYEIADDSNSTETFQQVEARKSTRGKSKNKANKEQKGKQSKGKQSKVNVKLEQGKQETEDEYVPPEPQPSEDVKKSKRKASKTPKKKNKN